MTELKTSQHQVTCDTDCFSQIIKSATDDSYEIIRDCSYYSTCTDASYTRDGHTYVSRCCGDELCNADLGEEIFQCFDCEAEDGPESQCQDVGFRETDFYSRKTAFCGTACEKTITTDNTSGKKTVRRSCRNDCVEGTVTAFGISTETYCCVGDICNSSASITVSLIVITVLAFVSYLVQ